jgi:predicted transcriptional regulator
MKRSVSKLRRERGRWIVLRILQASRPIGTRECIISRILTATGLPYSTAELRRELAWMRAAGLVEIIEEEDGAWAVRMTRDGIDIAEYSVPPPAGIRRPQVKRHHAAA